MIQHCVGCYSLKRSRGAAAPAPIRGRPSDECGEPCRESVLLCGPLKSAAGAGGYWAIRGEGSSEESNEETECAGLRG